MKNILFVVFNRIIITLFICLSVFSANAQNDSCSITDPLDNPNYGEGIDLCCGMVFPEEGMICYDMGAYPSVNNVFYFISLTIDSIVFSQDLSTQAFSSFEELATKMTTACSSLGFSGITFLYDNSANWICANTSESFGFLNFCTSGGSDNCSCIEPLPHACPFEIPDASISVNEHTGKVEIPTFPPAGESDPVLFNPNCEPFTLSEFQDSIATDWGSEVPDGVEPPSAEYGAYMMYLASEGGVFSNAACFNFECLNVNQLASQIASDPVLGNEVNEYLESIGEPSIDMEALEDSLQFMLEDRIEAAGGTVTAFINQQLGWNLTYRPCDSAGINWQNQYPGYEVDTTGLGDLNSSFNQDKMFPPSGSGTEADIDYFSKDITGLGRNGAASSSPSPSALKMIEQIKSGVNLYNGSQNSSIPLWNLQASDVSVPIGLSSSNNGLKINDLGGIVGQNWQLNAGEMITRVVKGLPDEYKGTIYGKGKGRVIKLRSRVEMPASTGLKLDIPALFDICDNIPFSLKENIITGFPLANTSFNLNHFNSLKLSWSILKPTFINFNFEVWVGNLWGIDIYFMISMDVGFAPNPKLGTIEYEEKGLGFFHSDNSSLIESHLGGDISLPKPLWKELSDDDQKEYLKLKHPSRKKEDGRFLNDHFSVFADWIESFQTPTYKTVKLDSEPDEFYFNIDGYAGKFSFNADGEVVIFPQYDIEIKKIEGEIGDDNHIIGFTIKTPKGMEYTFGFTPGDVTPMSGVEIVENVNYYLPNFYTFPELGFGRSNKYGKAQIDKAQLVYNPFWGPKRSMVYNNTYERNYKRMTSPKYTSSWHIKKKVSALSKEKIDFEYKKQELVYYSDKSYNYTYPNFEIKPSSLVSLNNNDLNPRHFISTKWQSGRAEFSYSATQAYVTRWVVDNINNNRGEEIRFEYDKTRQEIINSELCSRILVLRNSILYKGWELTYENQGGISLSSTCEGSVIDSLSAPFIQMEMDEVFNLGDIYALKDIEYYSSFFIDLKLGSCKTFRLPFYFGGSIFKKEKGGRTKMSEHGSLMEVKKLLGEGSDENRAREDAIYSAEYNRTFLKSIHEIDTDTVLHDFITDIYYDKIETLKKRFSVHQDVYGYFNDNSSTLSPLPPLNYSDINGVTVNSETQNAGALFGFYNDYFSSSLIAKTEKGQNEVPTLAKVKIGTIHSITLATGAKISYTYELNELPDGAGFGAGVRVKSLTEDPFDEDSPPRVTEYKYNSPTIINKPIRIYQCPNNSYYWRPNTFLEQKVVSTSSPQNMLFPNKGNNVGYEEVKEIWDGLGYVKHYFTSPLNYTENIKNVNPQNCKTNQSGVYYAGKKRVRNSVLLAEDWSISSLCISPSLEFVADFSYMNYLLGLEYKTEVFTDLEELIQSSNKEYNSFKELYCPERVEITYGQKVLRYSKSTMYQNNYTGNFSEAYAFRQIVNRLPYSSNTIHTLVDFLVNLIQGTVTPHFFKRIGRHYTIADYQLQTTYIQTTGKTTTEYFNNGADSRSTSVTYAYENAPRYERLLTETSKALPSVTGEGKVITTYAYPNTTGLPELAYYTQGALDHLDSVAYNIPISSRTFLGDYSTLKSFNCTAKAYINNRIVPLSNWVARNGNIQLQGKFSGYNSDGKPGNYFLAKYGAVDSSMLADSIFFFDPIELAWNTQLQLTSRKYINFETSYTYNDFFELENQTNPDAISASYTYDSRRRLDKLFSSNGRQVTEYAYSIGPGINTIETTILFNDGMNPSQGTIQKVDGFGRMLCVTRENDGAKLQAAKYDKFFRQTESFALQSGITSYDIEASPIPRTSTVTDVLGNTVKTVSSTAGIYFGKTAVTDPNQHTSYSYTDALGRLNKQVSGEGGETRYVYDDLSRVSIIVNPILETFAYSYNDMDKLSSKVIPGAKPWLFAWDKSFRPHAILRSNGALEVMQYDKHNRILGIYNPAPGTILISASIVDDNAFSLFYDDEIALKKNIYADNHTWVAKEQDRILTADSLGGWKIVDSLVRDNVGRVLSQKITYPTLDYDVKQINEYTDANLMAGSDTKTTVGNLSESIGYAFEFNDILLPTKTTASRNGVAKILSWAHYDSRDLMSHRLIGQSASNPSEFLQDVSYGYDELGRLIRINTPGSAACLVENEFCEFFTTFTMEKSNKCLFLKEIQIDDNIISINPPVDFINIGAAIWLEITLDSLLEAYGFFGEVNVEVQEDGPPSGANPLIFTIQIYNTIANTISLSFGELVYEGICNKVTFSKGNCCTYNLTTPSVTDTTFTYSPNPSLFYEKLTYEGINISQIEMSLDCGLGILRNEYDYDADHRVTDQYNTLLGSVAIPDAYTTNYSYDLAGNIQTLNRNGYTGTINGTKKFDLIDNLSYIYSNGSSVLETVRDSVETDSIRVLGYPLKEGTYTYDYAGNMTKNPATDIDITYNIIDLPKKVRGGANIDYIYTYGGEKIQQVKLADSTSLPETRTYIAGMEFVNDTLESIQHSDGRLLMIKDDTIPHYQYRIADHLGNTVVFFEDKDGDGLILDTANDSSEVLMKKLYYPFGMDLDGVMPQVTAPLNRYKYNGKEELEGVGLYDYGARFYDASIGRWTSVDPLAETYAPYSPYNYVLGNPIIFIDPDGRSVIPGQGWKGSQYQKVYKRLRRRSSIYVGFLSNYEKSGGKDYVLNNTTGRGNNSAALAGTSVDFDRYGGQENFSKRALKSGKKSFNPHIQSNFFSAQETKNIGEKQYGLNDLGRALVLIHEGGHAALMSGGSFGMIMNQGVQHDEMATNLVGTIRSALQEYDSGLTNQQLDLLSITGLINEKGSEAGNKLITQYAKTYWGETIGEGGLDSAFDRITQERNQLIYDETK